MRFKRHYIVGPLLLVLSGLTHAQGTSVQREVALPPGGGSSWLVSSPQVLDNGWIVVVDRGFSFPGPPAVPNVGAFHVFEPDGTLRQTYTGKSPNEELALLLLGGTRAAVYSRGWRNEDGEPVGALMLVDLAEPLPETITPANAVVGSQPGDLDQLALTPVGSTGVVIGAPRWDRGNLVDAGAARWLAADGSNVGEITEANALVGRLAGSAVGGTVFSMGATDWLVFSSWREGGVFDSGAITHVAGAGPFVGEVSASNSLYGASPADQIGSGGFVRLPNGALLVLSPAHDGPGEGDSGAITRFDPRVVRTGPIGPGNSLLGRSLDRLGSAGSVTVLPDGHIVITVPDANRNPAVQVGAVAYRRSDLPLTGWLEPSNALYGNVELDRVGSGGIRVLADGSYLVLSPNADIGDLADAGAATIGPVGVGVAGLVSAANSRVGRSAGDRVGSAGATPLVNGGAVVLSPQWRSDSGVAGAGAATLMRSSAEVGAIDATNSLVGATAGDFANASTAALANGHYVVVTPAWNGAPDFRSAVTWADGADGATGLISAARSIVGSAADFNSLVSATALTDGHYVIAAPRWRDPLNGRFGGAFWIDGTGPNTGPIAGFAGRATTGVRADAQAGLMVFSLAGGGHLVWTAHVDTPIGILSALTHVRARPDGPTIVTAENSLYGGSSLGGLIEGAPLVVPRADGSWIASTRYFSMPGVPGPTGAMTVGWADGSTVGPIDNRNSVIVSWPLAPSGHVEHERGTWPVLSEPSPTSPPAGGILVVPIASDPIRQTQIVLRTRTSLRLLWPGIETSTRLLRLEGAVGSGEVEAIIRVRSLDEVPAGRVEVRDHRGAVRCASADATPVGDGSIEFRCSVDTTTIPARTLTAEFYGYPRFAFSRSSALEAGQFVDGFER